MNTNELDIKIQAEWNLRHIEEVLEYATIQTKRTIQEINNEKAGFDEKADSIYNLLKILAGIPIDLRLHTLAESHTEYIVASLKNTEDK